MDRVIGSSDDRVKSDHFHIWAKEGCWCGAQRCSALLAEDRFYIDMEHWLYRHDGTLFTLLQECAKASVKEGRCEVHQ